LRDVTLSTDKASGVLEKDTTVTQSEMLEHSFYQLLNAAHIAFLHFIPSSPSSLSSSSSNNVDVGGATIHRSPTTLLLALAAVTAPWLVRSRFPVNHFSANYARSKHAKTGAAQKPLTIEAVLYRAKKWQYLLYKHFLLHGLNISLVLAALVASPSSSSPSSSSSLSSSVATTTSLRVYWLALNASYVLEFFLQTLVKKRALSQSTMLALNQLLMLVATVAATRVIIEFVDVRVAAVSLSANLVHRSADFANVAIVAAAALLWQWLLTAGVVDNDSS
jgi:hypothetical protein